MISTKETSAFVSPVSAIFESLTDGQLKAVIRDLQQQEETGIIPEGAARQLAQRLVVEIGIAHKDAFQLVQQVPMRLAAYKWAQD